MNTVYKTRYTFEVDHSSEVEDMMTTVRNIITAGIKDDDTISRFMLMEVHSERV